MYAVIKAGGKQYTVKPGDVLRVEKLEADLGAEIEFREILLVGGEKTFVGPNMEKAVVTVVVTNQQRAPKVIVFKKKRRQGYRRMGGHRQPYTEIFIKSITSPEGQTVAADGKPLVFDPEKRLQKLAKREEVKAQRKLDAKKEKSESPVKEASKRPAKKAATKKKVTKKKAATKKVAGKKKTAKKKTAKKK